MTQTIAEEVLALVSAHREKSVSLSAVASRPSDEATQKRKIDTDQAERHLRLCGNGPQDAVILCAYGETNRYANT